LGNIIDGKGMSKVLQERIKEEASMFTGEHGRPPGLAVILVGDDPASKVYVRNKEKACERAGIISFNYRLSSDKTHDEVVRLIKELNLRNDVDGILVQLPLPSHLDADQVLMAIDPSKDVDGFHPYNLGRLLMGLPTVVPCTPQGIMYMLRASGIDPDGKDAVVIGRSNIVGKPVATLLTLSHATVTICHSHTKDLDDKVKAADILISAVGKPRMVKGEWIKQGAVVIDVGITRDKDGKLTGDVDFDVARKRASLITPVPGGVGPMTIAMLLMNTMTLAKGHVS